MKIMAVFVILFIFVTFIYAQEDKTISEVHSVEGVSTSVIKIGNVEINKTDNQLSFPGTICLNNGPLEYLIVTLNGKIYESVIAADVDPIDLQASLLLMGLDCGGNIGFQGDSAAPVGDPIDIYISWTNDNKQQRAKGEDFVWNVSASKKMEDTKWIFSGSAFIENQLMAKIEGSLVAVFNDPAAIINNPLPGRGDDTVYAANEKIIPPIGTPLTIIFKIPEKKGAN